MNFKTKCMLWMLVLVVACFILTTTSNACPSCYGDARSSRFDGMNAAILTMIGITGTVFAGFGGFVLRLRKRMQNIPAEESGIMDPSTTSSAVDTKEIG